MAKKRRGSGSLKALSTSALQAELHRRRGALDRLERKRNSLAATLARLDAEIERIAGVPTAARGMTVVHSGGRRAARGVTKAGAPRKRPKNDSNLVEALKALLTGKTMSVTQASAEVQKAGYKTSSANFRTIVNQTLIREKNTFKKVSRGQYTSK